MLTFIASLFLQGDEQSLKVQHKVKRKTSTSVHEQKQTHWWSFYKEFCAVPTSFFKGMKVVKVQLNHGATLPPSGKTFLPNHFSAKKQQWLFIKQKCLQKITTGIIFFFLKLSLPFMKLEKNEKTNPSDCLAYLVVICKPTSDHVIS